MGDSKPTQILRVLQQQLEGMSTDEALLRQVFLQKLPSTVRTVVAANSDIMALADLAELADRVYEHLPSHEVNKTSTSSPMEERMSRLENMMERMVTAVSQQRSSSPRPPSRHRSRSRGRGFNPEGTLCYYHWRFREKASKCQQPCQWSTKNASNDQAK